MNPTKAHKKPMTREEKSARLSHADPASCCHFMPKKKAKVGKSKK